MNVENLETVMPTLSAMPGYRLNQYRLILLPQEDLAWRILQQRRMLVAKFPEVRVAFTRPYIALADFMQYEMKEERLQHRLRCAAMAQHAFRIQLRGFEMQPQGQLSVAVEDPTPIKNLIGQVRFEARRLMKLNEHTKPHFAKDPVLPLAFRIPEDQMEQVSHAYEGKRFEGKILADAMLLLKKPQGQVQWQIAGRYEFMNLPVTAQQGCLFA